MKILKTLKGYEVVDNVCRIETNEVPIRILFLTDDIIRIRAGFDENFEEESYCLMMTSWEDRMDSLFQGSRKKIENAKFKVTDFRDHLILQGNKLKVSVRKYPLQISVYDEEGTCIYADISGIAYMKDSNNRRLHFSEIEMDDCFYGFGEKTGKFNKARASMKMNAKDSMGYDPEHTDGLYKHIPFYIKLSRKTKKAVGLFYHNTYECEFNMGKEKSNYWHYYSKYSADGGDIDLFLIAGPEISNVVKRYTDLTGKSALLPSYALGYLGSSMYYPELEENCDDAIVEFIQTNRKEDIPIDGFQLSSGYSVQEDNKRCTFTWNYKRFKDPKQFFTRMEEEGVTVTPNVKPGILLKHPLYQEMKEKGMFVKDSDGKEVGIGSWWGGEGSFFDFTDEKVRSEWSKYLTENVLDMGTISIWNDNCEYDSLVDKDSICSFEGKGGTIGQLKALMANLMCYTTDLAVKKISEGRRPFIVCRAGYSGIQQYAQTWAGDNLTCFESLKYNIATILGMGLSGVANHGCDIGGFYGPAPTGELFVRWVQNGIFQPRFSIHSVNVDNTVTEPWMYPEYTEYIREAIHFRYQMLPYLYSLMAEANRTGAPMMRAMCYEFQNDDHCYEEGIDFMLGSSLLVANIVEEGAKTRDIYFPKGSDFYDYHTREKYVGGQKIQIPVDISSIPIYIRSGAVIPYDRVPVKNIHKEKPNHLGLLVEASVDSSFTMYEDDGISYKYLDGEYRKTQIELSSGERVGIELRSEGTYQTSYQSLFVDLISREKGPFYVTVNDEQLEHYLYPPQFEEADKGWYYNHTLKSVQIKYPEILDQIKIIVSFEQFDMIGM